MPIDERIGRRSFIQALGAAGFAAMFPHTLAEHAAAMEVVQAGDTPQSTSGAKPSIRFAVCGMSHDHIYGIAEAIRRGGGELALAYASEPAKVAAFRKRYPDVKWASSEDE